MDGKTKGEKAFSIIQWGKTWRKGLPSTGVRNAKLVRQEQGKAKEKPRKRVGEGMKPREGDVVRL